MRAGSVDERRGVDGESLQAARSATAPNTTNESFFIGLRLAASDGRPRDVDNGAEGRFRSRGIALTAVGAART
jgi:hypothetical protein